MRKAFCVTEDFTAEALEYLTDHQIDITLARIRRNYTSQELITLLERFDILIIGIQEKMTKEILNTITTPKIIATMSIGLDHIDPDFFTSPLVKVVNCPTGNTTSVAEHIMGLILDLNKKITESDRILRNGQNNWKTQAHRPSDLAGKTLGIVGAGTIARKLIPLAKAFHMKLLCNTLHPDTATDLLKEGVTFVSLDTLLKEADIISLNVPLTNQTRHMIGTTELEKMKPNACLINAARGEVTDVQAVLDFASQHPQFHAGLDIDIDHPYTYPTNVIITPHLAGSSTDALIRMDLELVEAIQKASPWLTQKQRETRGKE